MGELETNLRNRAWLIERLRAEIIGPDAPNPDRAAIVDETSGLAFKSWSEFRKPKIQPNGEEVLWQDPPTKRYGAGILFPTGVTEEGQVGSPEETGIPDTLIEVSSGDLDPLAENETGKDPTRTRMLADDTENYEVTLANAHRPSAMGLSFLVDLEKEPAGMAVTVKAGLYRPATAHIISENGSEHESERTVWLRKPLGEQSANGVTVTVSSQNLLMLTPKLSFWLPGQEGKLQMIVVSRPYGSSPAGNLRLVTVSLVNTQERDAGRIDELCYYQSAIRVSGLSSQRWINPYPEVVRSATSDLDESLVNRLLYRDQPTYATGHGCSACWDTLDFQKNSTPATREVWTDCMPTHETPSVSADIVDSGGLPIRVSMRKLAGLDSSDDGFNEIMRLVEHYRTWIDALQEMNDPKELIRHVSRSPIPMDLRETASALILRCRSCLRRIEEGIDFLRSNSETAGYARQAFQLANEGMLISQLRSSRGIRHPHWEQDGRIGWDVELSDIDPSQPHDTKGFWRPFQIAFLLMSIKGMCHPEHEDRQTVDLIWFPTGGGKTEAYLGLTAFTILFNRLAGRRPGGAEVIMRYTLRMLTSQQFQRAALLFCALEDLRNRKRTLLGAKEFRLGMWVGGDATPNRRADAVKKLSALQRDPKNAANPFVLLKCPWCNALFGPQREDNVQSADGQSTDRSKRHLKVSVHGYREVRLTGQKVHTVVYRCSDSRCEYGKPDASLPITVIDEEIYECPPNMLICTVDKFALVAWKPEIRSIFGVGADGSRKGIPPSLVIQDELHLISGPLGSIVGAYETVFESLCTVSVSGNDVKPKIIASTATVSRASEQIKALYAREHVEVFPPSGLEASDSFFARYARAADGKLLPGRMYAGVLAPAHGSLQTTEARLFAVLLQYPAVMATASKDGIERDPWWTLLCFFNSLRELGGAATLFVADARDYLRVIIDRHGFKYSEIRQLLNWEELTSRVRGDHIPRAIQRLEVLYRITAEGHSRDTVEACLASNIIEVGIDIDRLSLMAIVGQPKTTSQYIQVSGRVGRKLSSPGLIVVAYSQSKPRDRSHYEQFQSYHQRMYAKVEPTSVTPFSPPAVDRTLHAVLVATIRQRMALATTSRARPFPLPLGSTIRTLAESMIRNRVMSVDPEESQYTLDRMHRRLAEWQAWDPTLYGDFGAPPEDPALMHPAGTSVPPEWNGHSWPTLTSLRNVDATCEASVTGFYNQPNDGGSQ